MDAALPLSIRLQRWWLFAFLVAIPFSTWYIVQAPFAISPINIFSVIFILFGLYNAARRRLPWSWPTDRGTLIVIGMLFLAITYGLLFSHPLRSGVGFWVSRLTQPMLVGLFAYQLFAGGRLKVEEVAEALFWSLLPLIIGGALQVAHVVPYRDTDRVSVAYRWPDTFGRYVEILLLVSFPWLFLRQRPDPRRVAVWALGAAVLSASLSYNVVASFVLGIVVMLLALPAAYARGRNLALGAILVAGIFTGFNARHLPKWHETVTASRSTRIEFWTVAAATIRQHPWTGIGLKGWQQEYPSLVVKYGPNRPPINWNSEQPQDVFLDALLKAGIPGLVAVTAVLLWPIRRGWQIVRLAGVKCGWFGLAMLGYGIGLLAFGLLDDPIWSDDTTPLLFTLFFGMAWVYTVSSRTEQSDRGLRAK